MKSFEILLDSTIKSHEKLTEIANRFISFAEDIRMIKLHVNLESDTHLVILEGTGSQMIENKSSSNIDVFVHGIIADQSSKKVTVSLEVYCISNEGLE